VYFQSSSLSPRKKVQRKMVWPRRVKDTQQVWPRRVRKNTVRHAQGETRTSLSQLRILWFGNYIQFGIFCPVLSFLGEIVEYFPKIPTEKDC
jgi:hypothetical protein